ncbi:hypothetical protein J6590_063062 [Homalodisca vitripennis]|nr:hypothetical protein J6590_063062 [Homalodisca vitripennis]
MVLADKRSRLLQFNVNDTIRSRERVVERGPSPCNSNHTRFIHFHSFLTSSSDAHFVAEAHSVCSTDFVRAL